ncbi:MAG: inorganic phosphate transporter [Sandaracinaceae bacterium]|nr:inorganic phosphate transporter [Sandaracinaceae bacterium]
MMEAIFDGSLSAGTLALLVGCLVVALGFEFVNGFHDTANAVATVIYTKTLKPIPAVMLSGLCNFAGVFVGGIAVAIAIIRLLPVELLVSAGVGRGLVMVISLLLSAMIWNLGTWWKGIPASSSHTLIGAILGVGMASSAMDGNFGEGVAWDKALHVGLTLLLSPVLGFAMSAGLLWILRKVIRDERVFQPPKGEEPPPSWIRGLLVLTCGGVSFSHGSNDGQKGVGLIMLILIGLVPAGFALDLDAPAAEVTRARAATVAMRDHMAPLAEACEEGSTEPECVIHAELVIITEALEGHATVRDIPRAERWGVREGILRIDDSLRHLEEHVEPAVMAQLRTDRAGIAPLTDYAPWWVILAVALALGIGTMIGWKRIVVTVGEKIGKSHLTYAQGASAELVAAITIGLSSVFGLPVSTTHVLSSGVAGTMVVEGSGLQKSTVRNVALAWVLTLPAAMAISATIFFALASIIG